MSHALLVLPKVWATASFRMAPEDRIPPVQKAGYRGRSCRKNPQPVPFLRANAPELQLVVKAPTPQLDTDLARFRKVTEAILSRYLTMSLDAARVPSLMGRELFPGQVSHTRTHGFDDVVHFVHDLTACLNRLTPGQQHLVRRIAMQGYSQPEVAAMLGISLRTIVRRYAEALDRLTAILIERKLLQLNQLTVTDQDAVPGKQEAHEAPAN